MFGFQDCSSHKKVGWEKTVLTSLALLKYSQHLSSTLLPLQSLTKFIPTVSTSGHLEGIVALLQQKTLSFASSMLTTMLSTTRLLKFDIIYHLSFLLNPAFL